MAAIAGHKAIGFLPEDAQAFNNLGNTLFDLQNLEQAQAHFEQAISIEPDYADAHNNLGNVLTESRKLESAEVCFRKAISYKYQFPLAHFNLGATLFDLGKLTEAKESFLNALELEPNYVKAHINLASVYSNQGHIEAARDSLRRALSIDPTNAQAYNNLRQTLVILGQLKEAEKNFDQAIACDPKTIEAHINQGHLQKQLSNFQQSQEHYEKALKLDPNSDSAHAALGFAYMAAGATGEALDHFQSSHLLRRNRAGNGSSLTTSKAKLCHDVEQFKYLGDLGRESRRFYDLAARYQRLIDQKHWPTATSTVVLTNAESSLLEGTYNQTIFTGYAPRVEGQCLSENFDAILFAQDYLAHEFGLAYGDDFLSAGALELLRNYLLESTIWYRHYKGGYLGAFLGDGLASPLMLQIASELKSKLPSIFDGHYLNEIWAFKYDSQSSDNGSEFSGIKAHADFAAVNVNFWITPSMANCDPSSGGLIVFNSEAPSDWTFSEYNLQTDIITRKLHSENVNKTIIPYAGNRVVIFNSNLFHETDRFFFAGGYENRRINITLLFGERKT